MTDRRRKQLGRWLLAALRNDCRERAEALIREGAGLSVRGADGETVLTAAIGSRLYGLVPALLEGGADPNVPGPYGYPLHLAAEWAREEGPALIELLVRHGARLDVRDDEGATPMFLAGKNAGVETIRTLQRLGAEITERNHELDTALTFASCWGFTERAAMLLELGMDVNARDDAGMSALSWASRDGHSDTVALLLRYGAEVEVVDGWGQTPLMYAAESGSARCVELLLEAGADPTYRDHAGKTALDHAAAYAGRDLVEWLTARQKECPPAWQEPAELSVERELSPDGEPRLRVGWRTANGGAYLERCDRFDEVVALLQRAEG